MSFPHEKSAQPMVHRIRSACVMLGISKATIYRLINAGELDCVRITRGTVGIPHNSLIAYAESRGITVGR